MSLEIQNLCSLSEKRKTLLLVAFFSSFRCWERMVSILMSQGNRCPDQAFGDTQGCSWKNIPQNTPPVRQQHAEDAGEGTQGPAYWALIPRRRRGAGRWPPPPTPRPGPAWGLACPAGSGPWSGVRVCGALTSPCACVSKGLPARLHGSL